MTLKNIRSTADIKVSSKISERIIGQDRALDLIKKAAKQRRHILLVGEPGTGKSMLGQALAELLPKEKLVDILTIPSYADENTPLIRTTEKGKAKLIVTNAQLRAKDSFKNQNLLMLLFIILISIVPYYLYSFKIFPFDTPIIYAASMIISVFCLIGFLIFLNLNKRIKSDLLIPKLLVDNSKIEKAPFLDATGAHAGALLGDVLHDPLQSFYPQQQIPIVIPTKSGNLYQIEKQINLQRILDPIFEQNKQNLIKQNNYEALFLPKNKLNVLGYKNNSLESVEVLSINRYKNKLGKLIKITTESGKELLVTPEHKIAIQKKGKIIYKKADKLTYQDKIIILKIEITSEKIKKIEQIPYQGYLYNLTTDSGNLFVNNILCKNSGGLGTPAYQRLIPGMIHRANGGVLFIDEIANLRPESQQELLTALQEKQYPITGQSERSSGAMVRSEPVPCDFILVAAGNEETVQRMHPALRSRIRGYGYEIYMNVDMPDTPENREKIAVFIAQEVTKDKKIPHFDNSAILEIIEEARRRATVSGKLTLRLRELGGLIRAAGDIAIEKNSPLVTLKHIKTAKNLAKTLEHQIADRYIEHKKKYNVIKISGEQVGRVNGLAIIGSSSSFSGIVLPIESEVTPGGRKAEFVATGKLGEIAKEAVKNVSAIILKYFGQDIKEKYDIFVQFLQTSDSGVEGDSASIAVATAIISALQKIPVKQHIALTGSLSVRGEVLAVGGISSKIEAAIDAGLKAVIIPKANDKDIFISKSKLKKIKIIPVTTIEEVLENALDWKNKQHILKKIKRFK